MFWFKRGLHIRTLILLRFLGNSSTGVNQHFPFSLHVDQNMLLNLEQTGSDGGQKNDKNSCIRWTKCKILMGTLEVDMFSLTEGQLVIGTHCLGRHSMLPLTHAQRVQLTDDHMSPSYTNKNTGWQHECKQHILHIL